MAITLRDYQEQAVTKAVWATQLEGNDLLVLATGAGKSIIVAEIANRLQKPILILQPSKEILEQNLSKLMHYVPASDIGVFSASMNSKKVRKYTFATIQSIYKKPWLFDDFRLVLLDEAHGHNIKNTDGMYSKFFASIGKPKVIGLTATPYRNMTGYHRTQTGELYGTTTLKLINRVKPEFWKRILINVGIGDLIDQGYLCPLEYENHKFLTHEEMKLNKSGTEFDLDHYAVKLGTKQQQIIDCVEDAQKRFNSVLVFCPSVLQAEKFSECIPGSACVSAKTPADARDRMIRQFKERRIQTIFNMGVLTTGFDHPELDCIVLLRPTRSLALYMQMLGRGVRIAEGKKHCTVIDWTNTVDKLGKIETVQLRKEQFPEYQHPMWELYSTTVNGEERWHNRPLYSYAIKSKSRSGYAARAQGMRF